MIDVVCGVIRKEGKFLITQRGDSKNLGKWEFPGGKVKVGETYFESITREIKEELSLEIFPINQIVNYPFDRFNLIFILCKMKNPEFLPTLNEHLDYKWIGPDESNLFNFMEGDIQFVEKNLSSL